MERIEGDGWKEALELYKAQADDLYAGRTPRAKDTGADGRRIAGTVSDREKPRVGCWRNNDTH
jgi:hypothetical protein